ncbi:hypothetical protein TRFO_30566 [Tritrichomonas foetus]|uniref:Initiator binding domain-containing protein n=1 Tax=Tritrichomonas foetus TaxID=1144522 RepID=A0A1J4JTH4_9EUKA|nr:hypothetical protein TRFO_30566 [Tritrichomonas foetus]|eukprot:OHT02371.1 hypothetical protein TRFO_30566 [Tritrichomonas foetus]
MDSMNGDIKVPSNHWNQLSREDQAAFMQLHIHFIKQQKEHFKDRKNNTFFSDISCLLQYIEYSPLRKDDRAICVGIACSGPFVCVNTQQLKIILGRCKSSINNCFQQIGYDALKTKGKSREAVLSIIPSLITEQNTLRKWTVRCASEKAMSCFVSRFPMRQLPLVGEEDLLGSLTQMGQPQISQISNANNTNNMNNTSPMNSIAGINHLNAGQLNSMNNSFNMNLNLNSLNTTPNNNSMNNNVMNNNVMSNSVMSNSVMNGMSYVDEQKGFQMPPMFPQQQNQSSPPPLIFGQQQFPPSRPIVLPAMTFGQSPQQPNQVPQQLQPMNFTQMNTTSMQNSRNTINNNLNTNMNNNMTSKMSNSMNNNISCMNNNSFSQNHSQSQFSNNQFNNMSNNANNNNNNNNQNQNQQSTFPQSISFEESFDIEFLSAFDNPNITANANNQSNNVTTSGNTNTRGSGGGDMFDITPSFSLNYLAEINFDEIDHDSVFDVGDSPLEPTSFFPRSQSAYLSSRFGDMPF